MAKRRFTQSPEKPFDAIILGGGPAGASCALWLKLLGLRPFLIEKRRQLGGLQALSPYPNPWMLGKEYKTGREFAAAVARQLRSHGVEFRLNQKVSIEAFNGGFSVKALRVKAPYLVLATGVQPVEPDFPITSKVTVGPGSAVEKLKVTGKRVAILGGGDNAFENYLLLQKKHPSKTTIFARHIRARKQFVSQIPVEDIRVGRYEVDSKAGRVGEEPYDHLIVLYGWQCRNPLEDQFAFQRENGFVKTDRFRRTSIPNIYAIGEITQAMHPCCVTAMADGIIAAKDIEKRLSI